MGLARGIGPRGWPAGFTCTAEDKQPETPIETLKKPFAESVPLAVKAAAQAADCTYQGGAWIHLAKPSPLCQRQGRSG